MASRIQIYDSDRWLDKPAEHSIEAEQSIADIAVLFRVHHFVI